MSHQVVDVGRADSAQWVLDKNLFDKIFCLCWDIFWNLILAFFNQFKCVVLITPFEWQLRGEHLEQYNTKSPDIAGIWCLSELKHLWGDEMLRAYKLIFFIVSLIQRNHPFIWMLTWAWHIICGNAWYRTNVRHTGNAAQVVGHAWIARMGSLRCMDNFGGSKIR